MFFEATPCRAAERLTLTGQLGDVMKSRRTLP